MKSDRPLTPPSPTHPNPHKKALPPHPSLMEEPPFVMLTHYKLGLLCDYPPPPPFLQTVEAAEFEGSPPLPRLSFVWVAAGRSGDGAV